MQPEAISFPHVCYVMKVTQIQQKEHKHVLTHLL